MKSTDYDEQSEKGGPFHVNNTKSNIIDWRHLIKLIENSIGKRKTNFVMWLSITYLSNYFYDSEIILFLNWKDYQIHKNLI